MAPRHTPFFTCNAVIMKNNRYTWIAVLCLFVAHGSLLAQQPDFSGTWVLNLQKSKLEHQKEGFTGSLFIIKQKGDCLRLTRYHFFGKKKNKLRFKMRADGKTRKIKLLFRGKLEKQDNTLKSTLWRKHFLNVVQYKFGIDQNEFIADEVYTGYPQDHHNIWVFDRQ